MIKHKVKLIALTSTILCSFSSLAEERISKITITGNKRIETSTIQSYLGLKAGEGYSLARQNEAIKNLYATGMFEDVSIKFVNGNLVVKVLEPAFISKVDFKGNSKIKSAVLSKELLTTAGESISKAKIQSDIQKIKEVYKRSGRFSVIVTPEMESQENNRVKVVFNITEGPKTAIRHIHFVGNNQYREGELKSVILTKETAWFRFLETNDTYDPDRIEYDKELLKAFYQSVGFADFRVISSTAELPSTKDYFTLTYSIEEGDKYSIGDVSVDSKIADIDVDAMRKLIDVKTGQIFNIKSLERVAEKMSDKLASSGYPQVNVYPDTIRNKDTKVMDIKFVIDKTDKIFVNRVNINGNLKTEDKVIRREFKIAEGDIFNRSYIEKGEQNLRNLDYFQTLSVKVVPTNRRDKYDINIDLEEKSTSSIGFDLGYNTAGGPFGRLSFLERNLVGTGKYLTAGVTMAKKSTNYYAGVTEPHFMDKDLSLSGNIFKNHSGKSGGFGEIEQNYILDSIGVKTSLGYEIKEDLSHDIDYTIKKDHLKASMLTSSRFITEQIGKFTTSSIGQSLTFDKTDSRIVPKNGYLITGSQEYAGLGGNNKYLKHEIDVKYFKSFINNKLTLKLAGSTGDIRGLNKAKTVRISDRFNLGDYSLRGFAPGGVGLRDKLTKEGLGGQQYYSFTTEFNFPLGLPEEFNLTGAVFNDIGSVWHVKTNPSSNYGSDSFYDDKSLRSSIGIGIIWVTRFAPIRIDYAWAIKKKPYDDRQKFHIKFSTHF